MHPPPDDPDHESDTIIGKRLLVGLTYMNADESVRARDVFYGPVVSCSAESIEISREDGRGTVAIPNDELNASDPEDVYTLESGVQVTGVFATCRWTIWPPDADGAAGA